VKRKIDRRVERTRRLLGEALVALIRERGFAALSVQDVLDRAGVGRATFYAHFDNKEDLLLTGLEGLREQLRALQRDALAAGGPPEQRLLGFGRELFTHTDAHRDLYRTMSRDGSAGLLQVFFHRMILDLVRDDVKASLSPATDPKAGETIAQFVAGGVYGLLMWWLGARVRPTAEEVDAHLRRLAIGAVTAGAA